VHFKFSIMYMTTGAPRNCQIIVSFMDIQIRMTAPLVQRSTAVVLTILNPPVTLTATYAGAGSMPVLAATSSAPLHLVPP